MRVPVAWARMERAIAAIYRLHTFGGARTGVAMSMYDSGATDWEVVAAHERRHSAPSRPEAVVTLRRAGSTARRAGLAVWVGRRHEGRGSANTALLTLAGREVGLAARNAARRGVRLDSVRMYLATLGELTGWRVAP
jgi:hypothetical protein